jgi:hypothetical protein
VDERNLPPCWGADTFECYVCHGTFEKPRTDEEALAEAEATWVKMDKPVPVCVDCAAGIFAYAQLDRPDLLR